MGVKHGEIKLRVFENIELKKAFGSKEDEVTGSQDDCMMRSFVICCVLLTKCYSGGRIKQNDTGGVCSTYERQGRYVARMRDREGM
jgi:hypothetical protein